MQTALTRVLDIQKGFVESVMRCIGNESPGTTDVVLAYLRALMETLAEYCGDMLDRVDHGMDTADVRRLYVDSMMDLVIRMEKK